MLRKKAVNSFLEEQESAFKKWRDAIKEINKHKKSFPFAVLNSSTVAVCSRHLTFAFHPAGAQLLL
jgi:hypothetical protein